MNYVKIHDKFIKYFKGSMPLDRIRRRNPEDARLFDNYIYTENHHILPKSQGGNNSPDNLVCLLPEEHLFIHFLRYKAFKNIKDLMTVKFCLNGYIGKNEFKSPKYFILSKHIRSIYSKHRQECQKRRKNTKWHSDEGLKKISEAMKNKLIVKDAKTGELMGKHDKNHPKILSGEWVHHTKGFLTAIDKETGKKVRVSVEEYKNNEKYTIPHDFRGSKNPNHSGFTDEEILELCDEFFKEFNTPPTPGFYRLYTKIKEVKMPIMINNSRFVEYGGGLKGFTAALEQRFGKPLNTRENRKEYYKLVKQLKGRLDDKNN